MFISNIISAVDRKEISVSVFVRGMNFHHLIKKLELDQWLTLDGYETELYPDETKKNHHVYFEFRKEIKNDSSFDERVVKIFINPALPLRFVYFLRSGSNWVIVKNGEESMTMMECAEGIIKIFAPMT